MPRHVYQGLGKNVWAFTKPGRYADGNGLYLVVSDKARDDRPNQPAARWYEWRGVVNGQRVIRGIGSAQQIKLSTAREIAAEYRQMARRGIDPKAERDRARRESLPFEAAARKVWREQIAPHAQNRKHKAQWINTLRDYAFPIIGTLPVHAVTQADILRVLAPIWTEKPETARRVRQRLRTVLDWACTAGHREGVNPVEGVEKGLPKQRGKVRHFRALPYADLPDLMRRIEGVEGVGALALRFAILTAARSGEVRGATWAEIDTEAKVWTIPGERMKAGEPHRVPLSDAALAVLETVKGLDRELVFPSRKQGKPPSDMTLAAVLKRLKVDATVHGMRSTFRDWCEEQTRFSREVKERALAHTVRDKVEAAYRRGDLFEQRRGLMDHWASFCCSPKGVVLNHPARRRQRAG